MNALNTVWILLRESMLVGCLDSKCEHEGRQTCSDIVHEDGGAQDAESHDAEVDAGNLRR